MLQQRKGEQVTLIEGMRFPGQEVLEKGTWGRCLSMLENVAELE